MANTTFRCSNNNDAGVIVVTVSPLGNLLNVVIWPDPITVTVTPLGTPHEAVLITTSVITVTLSFGTFEVLLELPKKNWVKWSDIGYLDFTIGKDNVAGQRPMDWKGWVYEIKKLGSRVIVYGENGVSALIPVGNTYGLDIIHKLGLKGKQAVAGDEDVHFFIDKEGVLWSIGTKSKEVTVGKAGKLSGAGESIDELYYSEYLASLNNPVLSWDVKNKLLYICDGALGFIYSPGDRSLGEGPINITGVGYQGTTQYIVAPATISTSTFEMWTDTYDMGMRRGKSTISLEFGIDLTIALKAAIRYRLNKAVAFTQTDWVTVDERGLAFIQCYGQEFQFGAKVDSYQYFELDYIKVNGRAYDSW